MSIDLRELEKAILQYFVLPLAYKCFCRGDISPRKILFADSKTDGIPYNLRSMYQEARKRGYECIDFCYNFETMSAWRKLCTSLAFMKQYATAKYVFISDYYLPVSSCRKRKETTVIQLWHASGLQKMFGFDAGDDLKNLKLINPVRNFDIVSVSAENMKKVMMKNWRLPAEKIQVLGSSRTDLLFDRTYLTDCRERFFALYPEAKGKTVVLWAPTFRGKGYEADIAGIDDVLEIEAQLKEGYYFIRKMHPHYQKNGAVDNCTLKTEELYAVADILITDYSSVFYDFILLKQKALFYVPDYELYKKDRGLYIDYRTELPFPVIRDKKELKEAIVNASPIDRQVLSGFKEKFVKMNDGRSSVRIMDYLEERHGKAFK